MRRVAVAAAIAALIFAFASTSSAEESCGGSGKILPKARIEKNLVAHGYVKIRGLELHDGCYEAKGFDKSGKRFELEINARTGAIAKKE